MIMKTIGLKSSKESRNQNPENSRLRIHIKMFEIPKKEKAGLFCSFLGDET